MQLETDLGSELPLALLDVTHPGLDAVRVDMFWQPASYPDVSETETEQEREYLTLSLPCLLHHHLENDQ